MYSKDCQTFYDLILADLESGRTSHYSTYLNKVNLGRDQSPWMDDGPLLTKEMVQAELSDVLDLSGWFSSAKLLGADEPAIKEPVKQEVKPPLRSAPTKAEPKTTSKKGLPKTGVETRKPVDQNDYTMCAVNSKQLGGNALTVVLIASAEFGLTAFKSSRQFCMVERELTAGYIADKMLKSRPVAIAALSEAVNLGFLERTDNGKGGRGNTNKAKYRPVLPAYLPAPAR